MGFEIRRVLVSNNNMCIHSINSFSQVITCINVSQFNYDLDCGNLYNGISVFPTGTSILFSLLTGNNSLRSLLRGFSWSWYSAHFSLGCLEQ